MVEYLKAITIGIIITLYLKNKINIFANIYSISPSPIIDEWQQIFDDKVSKNDRNRDADSDHPQVCPYPV